MTVKTKDRTGFFIIPCVNMKPNGTRCSENARHVIIINESLLNRTQLCDNCIQELREKVNAAPLLEPTKV